MADQVNYFDHYPKNIPTCKEAHGEQELETIAELNKIVSGPVEGNYCFIHNTEINEKSVPIKERSWKRQYLREAVQDCTFGLEIGFNAGHSSTIILTANPKMKLISLDICRYAYTLPCAKHLHEKFKDRFGFTKGSSQEILKGKKLNVNLDFIHVDGGHGLNDFYFDIDWSEKNLVKGGRLLVDDAYLPDYVKYLAYKIEQGIFKQTNPKRKSSGENVLLEKL
jgi:predicted O-methyltransferase YrrM